MCNEQLCIHGNELQLALQPKQSIVCLPKRQKATSKNLPAPKTGLPIGEGEYIERGSLLCPWVNKTSKKLLITS